MAEILTNNFDPLGINATFHLVRLVVLLVVLYVQWRQWREGRQTGYLIAFIAFAALAATELFIAYFYSASAVLHFDQPVSRHPLWGDFLQSLSLALFALSTPYLLMNGAQKIRWKAPALWSALFLLLVLLGFAPPAFMPPLFDRIVHYHNAILSLYAVGFLSWALIVVSRMQRGGRGQILISVALLVVSQVFHFGYFSGLTLAWFPIHYGERIFSTFGYIVYLGFLHDHILAEKRQLLKELQQSNAELRRQDRLKNGFLTLISHELRTPLTAMHTAATLLQKKSLARNEQQELAGVISRRSKSMAAQVEELLDVSRIQLGKLEYRKQAVDVNALLHKTLEDMRLVCKAKDIALEIETTGHDLPVFGDPNRLSQVLQNLFGNSIKFTPAGGRIAARCSEESNTVAISIEDTGTGIDAERLPHIFDLFYQTNEAYLSGGVGLGLFIAKSIVEAHDGRITVESTPGQGTTFTIYLDRIPEAGGAVPDASGPEHAEDTLFENISAQRGDLQ